MDEESFRIFYERSAPRLFAYLLRVSGERSVAEDLLQEAYCRFLSSKFPETDEASQRSYLFRIATNLMAWAQDDELVLEPITRFYGVLVATGNKPEAHIYSSGKHGFGMRVQGTSSDHWIDEFYWWLEAKGFTRREVK